MGDLRSQDASGWLRRIHDVTDRNLIFKITLPTVLLVLGLTLISAHILSRRFEATHEQHANQRTQAFADVVEAELEADTTPGHTELGASLPRLCSATHKSAALVGANGKAWLACSPELAQMQVTGAEPVTEIVTRSGTRFVRHLRPLTGNDGCSSCHGPTRPLGTLVVETSLAHMDHEVRDQKRVSLVAGVILAGVLSAVLVLVQVVLIYRPIRALAATVERIRKGDFGARIRVWRSDEMGGLAVSLNEMAASLEQAKIELERTQRAELAQAEKLAALGQLTSSVAHEIKNPLSGTIGALRVLEAEVPATDPHKAILTKVLASMQRLSQTAVELLEFARPLKPTMQDVDVCQLLDRTLFFIERQAAAQGVVLRRCYPAEHLFVHVDPDLMKQVFLNLLLNGVQAMPKGGVLEIVASAGAADEGAVEVTIADQGVGIPPEALGRIFSPFFSTKLRGTGLGLFVARQMVETQQGEIRVTSQVGRGSAFTVRLPAARPEPEPEPEPEKEECHATG